MQSTRTSPVQSPPTTESPMEAPHITCPCGRLAELRPVAAGRFVAICPGCDQPIESCTECTRTAIPLPEQLEATVIADTRQQSAGVTLGVELDAVAKLLEQLAESIRRALASGGEHLGPLFTVSQLEHVLETLLGSASFHSKPLGNKIRELRENQALYADRLRDMAQKAQIAGNTQESRRLSLLATNLSKQLSGEGVAHV